MGIINDILADDVAQGEKSPETSAAAVSLLKLLPKDEVMGQEVESDESSSSSGESEDGIHMDPADGSDLEKISSTRFNK